MQNSFFRSALILGLLSAMGPFAIDMYLPALPAIGESLQADTTRVQWTLMAFFLALGLCQLAYGPASDAWGRKPPLYFGLGLFALGSIGCALAPDIPSLVAFRFIEGVGACAGMVIPRAIVRDLHTGAEATKLTGLLMLVFSVSPILAPLAGSFIIALSGWRGVFWAVTGLALLGLTLMARGLDETRPPAHRVPASLSSIWGAYRLLLRDRHFLGLSFIGAFGMASFFAYLANSPFVLIEHYGLTPMQYSFFFSINAASFIGMAQFNGALIKRMGMPRVVRLGVGGAFATALGLFVLFAAGVDRLEVLAPLVFVSFGFLGLVVPTTAVMALDHHGEIAGTASALMGTLQMVTGAAVMAVIAWFVNGTPLPMVAGIALCSLVAWGLAQRTLGRDAPALAPASPR